MCDDGSFYWRALDFADDALGVDCPDLELSYPDDSEDISYNDDDDENENEGAILLRASRLPRRHKHDND